MVVLGPAACCVQAKAVVCKLQRLLCAFQQLLFQRLAAGPGLSEQRAFWLILRNWIAHVGSVLSIRSFFKKLVRVPELELHTRPSPILKSA